MSWNVIWLSLSAVGFMLLPLVSARDSHQNPGKSQRPTLGGRHAGYDGFMTQAKAAPIDLSTSVAGEEDPGASIDLAGERPSGQAPMAPGDEAPAGTPGTGEKPCPRCGGSGRLGGSACPE